MYQILFIVSLAISQTDALNIETSGTQIQDSNFKLICKIPSFSGPATWSKNGKAITECSNSIQCTTTSTENYKFTVSSSGIILNFDPLMQKDNGTIWRCFHSSESAGYTVHVLPLLPTTQATTSDVLPLLPTTQATTSDALNIETSGTQIQDSNFKLICKIPSFSGPATWSKNGKAITECSNSIQCTTTSTENYKFTVSSSGIILNFDPLMQKDNGTIWRCFHRRESAGYTVHVLPLLPTTQATTSEDGLSGGVIAGIVIGVIVGLCIIIIAAGTYILRNLEIIKKFRKL